MFTFYSFNWFFLFNQIFNFLREWLDLQGIRVLFRMIVAAFLIVAVKLFILFVLFIFLVFLKGTSNVFILFFLYVSIFIIKISFDSSLKIIHCYKWYLEMFGIKIYMHIYFVQGLKCNVCIYVFLYLFLFCFSEISAD